MTTTSITIFTTNHWNVKIVKAATTTVLLLVHVDPIDRRSVAWKQGILANASMYTEYEWIRWVLHRYHQQPTPIPSFCGKQGVEHSHLDNDTVMADFDACHSQRWKQQVAYTSEATAYWKDPILVCRILWQPFLPGMYCNIVLLARLLAAGLGWASLHCTFVQRAMSRQERKTPPLSAGVYIRQQQTDTTLCCRSG